MFIVTFPDDDTLGTALSCCRRLRTSDKLPAVFQRRAVESVIELLDSLGDSTSAELDADQARALRMAVYGQRDTTNLHFAASVGHLARQMPDALTLPWWFAPDEQVLTFIGIGTRHRTAGRRPTFMIAMPNRETLEVALADKVSCGVSFDGETAAAAIGELWDEVAEVSIGMIATPGHPHLLKVVVALPRTVAQRNRQDNQPEGRLTHDEVTQLAGRVRAAAVQCGARPMTLCVKEHVGMLPVDWPSNIELTWST
ncbi:hypothetical protein [Catellatospora methionotrophica]|uniref:hypothetical protein n=1 Tax=Catellatospora methionotrophica TaxID=121620 RepID=UPI0033D0CD8F